MATELISEDNSHSFVRVAKDLAAGAAGGVAQVLVGELRSQS